MKYLDLFMAFFRVGIFGYGGGPSSIPLVYKEAVERYKWMSEDDFSDILALGNALPGPIATKMAGYIGYRVGGVTGMIVSLFANIVPTVVVLILLMTVLNKYKGLPWVQGIAKAVVPVVGVMMATLTWSFIKKSQSYFGWIFAFLLTLGSLLLLEVFSIHPAIIIVGLLLVALLKKTGPDEDRDSQGEKVRTS